MGITIKASYSGNAVEYLQQVMGRLQKTEEALVKVTNQVAKYWQRNYQEEGALIGGWAALAQATQDNRAQQGFDPSGPIMIRHGGLVAMSTTMFANAQGSTTRSERAPYDPRGITATGQLSIRGNVANLSVSGPQVFNHWPGVRIPRPARPIWFVDKPVAVEAGRAVGEWISDALRQ